jgi:hypothetical protein
MTVPDVDWENASTELRRHLYGTVKKLWDSGRLSRQDFFTRAFPDAARLGPSFMNNFSTGKVSTPNAALIYDFLRRHFRESAYEVFTASYDQKHDDNEWTSFVFAHGFENPKHIDNNIKFVDIEPRSDNDPVLPPDFTIERRSDIVQNRHRYLLQYFSAIAGYAATLFAYGDQWFVCTYPEPTKGRGWQWLGAQGADYFMPVVFESEEPFFFVVVSGTAELVNAVAYPLGGHDHRYPLRERHIRSLPSLFRAAEGEWEILYLRSKVW